VDLLEGAHKHEALPFGSPLTISIDLEWINRDCPLDKTASFRRRPESSVEKHPAKRTELRCCPACAGDI